MATVWLELSTRGKVNLTIRTQCIDPEIDPKIGDEIHLGKDTDDKHLYAIVSRVAHFLLSNGSAVVTCYDVTPLALFIAISQNASVSPGNLAMEIKKHGRVFSVLLPQKIILPVLAGEKSSRCVKSAVVVRLRRSFFT